MKKDYQETTAFSGKENSIRRNRIGDKAFPYLLIAPTLILILAIMIYPVFNVFNLSLQDYSLNFITQKKFVGLQNFINIFTTDDLFRSSIGITLKWVVLEVGFQLVLGLVIALLLNETFKFRGLVRAIVLVPWAVSGVLTTMLWTMMYDQHIGLINDILIRLGIIHQNIAWISDTHTFFGAVVIAELWRGIPFFAITLLAALQSVPGDIYESCQIDGCGGFKKLIYMTLPFLKESIIFATLLRGMWEFNSIDMIFTMTNGGPMSMTTTLPIYMMQTSVIQGNYGYGSALGVISFFILLLFAIIYISISGFGKDEQ